MREKARLTMEIIKRGNHMVTISCDIVKSCSSFTIFLGCLVKIVMPWNHVESLMAEPITETDHNFLNPCLFFNYTLHSKRRQSLIPNAKKYLN
jgi:hypothetical protein